MNRLLLLLAAVALGAGCRRETPPPDPEPEPAEAPAEAPICERAYENVLRIEQATGASHQTINRLKRTRDEVIAKCKGSPAEVRQCLADAPDRKALARCAFEAEGSQPPKPGLRERCEQVYDRMIDVLRREKAPAQALERMTDRREQAITECTREPESVVDCLSNAQSSTDIRSCRSAAQGAPTPPDPKLVDECRAIHARLLSDDAPAGVPARFRDRWKTRADLFVEECARMTPAEVACMTAATAFEDYRRCLEPKETP